MVVSAVESLAELEPQLALGVWNLQPQSPHLLVQDQSAQGTLALVLFEPMVALVICNVLLSGPSFGLFLSFGGLSPVPWLMWPSL